MGASVFVLPGHPEAGVDRPVGPADLGGGRLGRVGPGHQVLAGRRGHRQGRRRRGLDPRRGRSASSVSRTHIEHFTQEVLAGSLRSIVGRLSVDEIIKDRAAFAREVAEEAETSLTNQGLVLDTFQLQDIQTEGNHLKDLGRPGGGPGREGGGDRRVDRPPGGRAGPHQGRGGDRRRQPGAGPAPGPILAETDAASAQAEAAGPIAKAAKRPGGHRRPGAGGRAPGPAARAPARHRGAQAGRRRALRGRDGRRGRQGQHAARGRGRAGPS